MSDSRPFELRAGMQLMQRLVLRDTDIEAFRRALHETVNQAPAMFRGALLLLDLTPLRDSDVLPDFAALAAALREAAIVPAGVCNAGPAQTQAAHAAGWGVIAEPRGREPGAPANSASGPASHRTPARVVTQPVRSGQQVHTPGDLILLAQVSAGAEVLAGGSIHVHGPLRGRALAGIRGDETATISCTAFHAELVSIAGRYRTLEDSKAGTEGGPAYIHLEGEQLCVDSV